MIEEWLPAEELSRLEAALGRQEYPELTVLLHEGSADGRFFLLLAGEVEIVKALGTADERVLGTSRAGALLGEMSLFSANGSHTASVRALTRVTLVEMSRATLDDLLRRQPGLAYGLVRILSRRLGESENATILELRAKNEQLERAYRELQQAQAQLVEKERLERELEIARRIQQSILPEEVPWHEGYDVGALMVPARAVGGDMYDLVRLDADRLGIVVGDVADKGVAAALFMMLVYSLLRAEVGRHPSPGAVLRAVNGLLLGMNPSGQFVTLLYGILEYAGGCFTYARAGHPHPLIFDRASRRVDIPSAVGQPLGLWDEPLLDVQSVVVPPGGAVLVFSDGLSEALDEPGDDGGLEWVSRIMAAHPTATAEEICHRLWQEAERGVRPDKPMDDFVVVTVKRTA